MKIKRNNTKYLLFSCSSKKNKLLSKGPAYQIYTGTLLQFSIKFATLHNLTPLILSAKYGFISITKEIENYDQKLKKPYNDRWPSGSGYFIGSSLYFKNVPDRFQPWLTKKTKIGVQLGILLRLNKWKKTKHKSVYLDLENFLKKHGLTINNITLPFDKS